MPYNKYPYIPPGADYDPGPPVTQLPPGVPPGPGPAPYAPFPLPVPPVTPGPPPPALPYNPPADLQVPPYGQLPPTTGAPTTAAVPEPLPAEASGVAGLDVTTYDSANGLFQDRDGEVGVFAAADGRVHLAENWADLMLAPREF